MKRFIEFLREDWMRKLFALFFAITIYWNINAARQKEEVFHNVPVEVNLSPDLYMPGSNLLQVSMTIRGTEERLQKLAFERPSGKIDIDSSMITDGKCRITLTPANFSCGSRNKVISISPAEIELNVQRRITRKIPVKPAISGKAASGYELFEYKCQPAEIEVTGPEDTIAALENITTETIGDDLGDSNSNFRVKVINPMPQLLSIAQEQVLVTTLVTQVQEVEKVFNNIKIMCLSDLRPLNGERFEITKIEPAEVNVTIAGSKAEINRISARDIRVFAYLSGRTIDGGISLEVPLQYQVVSGGPVKKVTLSRDNVKVFIKKVKIGQ